MFISLYTTRLVLNALGAADFGIFNLVGGAIAMLGFLNAAMASATQRFMSYSEGEGDKEKQKKIFNISIVLHLGIALLLALFLLGAGWFFFNGLLNIPESRIYAAKVIYTSLIISTVFTVMSVPYDAIMNAHENMLYYSIIGILEAILKLLVAVYTIHFIGDKLIIYGILMACVPIFILIITRIYCHRKYDECVINPRLYIEKPLLAEMGKFATWNLAGNATGMINQYGSGILLNSFFGTRVNTAQGIANQSSGMIMTFSNLFVKVFNPTIDKAAGSNQNERFKRAILLGAKIAFIAYGIFAVPLLFETNMIVKKWLGQTPQWVVLFVRFQIIRTLIDQTYLIFIKGIEANGNIGNFTKTKSIVNFLPLPISYMLFLNGWPAHTIYVVWILVSSIGGFFITLFFLNKKCKITYTEIFYESLSPIIIGLILSSLFCLAFGYAFENRYLCFFMSFVATVICMIFSFIITMHKVEKEAMIKIIMNVPYFQRFSKFL